MIQLDVLFIPENRRGQGIGTYAMMRICRYADLVGETIILSASLPVRDVPYSAEAERRLVKWYKGMGFVDSKIKEINYSPKNMICDRNILERPPVQPFPCLDIVVT